MTDMPCSTGPNKAAELLLISPADELETEKRKNLTSDTFVNSINWTNVARIEKESIQRVINLSLPAVITFM